MTKDALADLKALINKQAEDESLWSIPLDHLQPIAEAYLQQELRRLHEACERLWRKP